MLQELKQIFDREQERFLEEWKQLLRIPSISAQPEYHQACRRCAEWLMQHLARMGFSSRLLETPGKPVVFAERAGRPGKPVVLFYGHYDVQPVDPIEQWSSPPFEPALKAGRLYARGAQDDKGQLFSVLKAVETLIRLNRLDVNFKIALEGEEESRSKSLAECLPRWKELLKADVLMVADTNTVASGAPAIVMGLRGIVTLTVSLSGPRHDLHSGVHGGLAPNPAQAMARLLASLHHPDGAIAVPGFGDSIAEPTPRERELARGEPFSAERYQGLTGVPPIAGDQRFDPVMRVGFRPSIDINGIHSGYDGPGPKTIIPARATAKISARVVKGQDPARCLQSLIEHLQRETPPGLKLEISEPDAAGPGFRLDPDSPLAIKAKDILDRLSDQKTAFLWEGASIPIVSSLAEISGAQPILVGFGRQEDRAHAPDESFSLDQFRLGFVYAAMMLQALGA